MFWLAFFALSNSFSELEAQELSAVVENRSGSECVVIQGLKNINEPTVVLRLADSKSDSIGILGKTEVEDQTIIFKPRFPLLPKRYVVEVQSSPQTQSHQLAFEIRSERKLQTKVTAVYPSADELPANTLKFYVHFSAPMRKGEIYQFVCLKKIGKTDQESENIELPFLEIEQEFWSRDSKRITLLLDPGRIKRGLKPREEMGPIFEPGGNYELEISQNWADGTGAKLSAGFTKRFRATADDFRQPNPETWKIQKPAANSTTPLVVTFPSPLDHAMLQNSIVVEDEDGKAVNGMVKIAGGETTWTFQPTRPWRVGRHKLSVNENLEDNSGNSIGRRFEVDIFDTTESTSPSVTELEFMISR